MLRLPNGKLIQYNGRVYYYNNGNKYLLNQDDYNILNTGISDAQYKVGDTLTTSRTLTADWDLCNASSISSSIAGLSKPTPINGIWTRTSYTSPSAVSVDYMFTSTNGYYVFGIDASTGNVYRNTTPSLTASNLYTISGFSNVKNGEYRRCGDYIICTVKSSSAVYVLRIEASIISFIRNYHVPSEYDIVDAVYDGSYLYFRNSDNNYIIRMTSSTSASVIDNSSITTAGNGLFYYNGYFYTAAYSNADGVYSFQICRASYISSSTSWTQMGRINGRLSYVTDFIAYPSDEGNVFHVNGNNQSGVVLINGNNLIIYDGSYNYGIIGSYNNYLFLNMSSGNTPNRIIYNDSEYTPSGIPNEVFTAFLNKNNILYMCVNNIWYTLDTTKYQLPLIDVDQTGQAKTYIKIR